MEVVLDSNVLFRFLITGGNILDLFFNKNLKILAPEKLRKEFFNNKDEILSKSRFSELNLNELVSLIFKEITWISDEQYFTFIPKARQLLGKHEKDEDFIALCLVKNIKLWTYEKLLFDIGFGVSTKQISEQLSKL